MENDGVTEGYIYIMFNEIFNYYRPDTVKIGKSIDVAKRMNAYTTSYVKPTELKYVSQLCKNDTLAESAVFKQLHAFRMAKNREFFRGDAAMFVETIDAIVDDVNNGHDPPHIDTEAGVIIEQLGLKIAVFRQLQSKLKIDPFDVNFKIVVDTHAVATCCDAVLTDDEYITIQKRFRTELRKPTTTCEYYKLYVYLSRHLTSKDIWHRKRGLTKQGRCSTYSINTELLQTYGHIFNDDCLMMDITD